MNGVKRVSWYQKARHTFHPFIIRVPREDFDEIKRRAQSNGNSIHEEILTYIEWGLENNAD